MTTQMAPTAARRNFFGMIKDVTTNKNVVEIIPTTGEEGVAVISLSDWRSIQETLFLEQCGVLEVVRQRIEDDSGFTNIDDIDWEEL